MADAEDMLKVGVRYEGADAIAKFGSDLGEIPIDMEAMLRKLAATGGDQSLLRRKGQEMVKAVAAGIKLEQANLAGLLNVSGLGSGLGSTVSSGLGVPARNTRQIAEYTRMANQAADMLRTNSFGMKRDPNADYLSNLRTSLVTADAQSGKLAKSLNFLGATQEKLNRIPSKIYSDAKAIQTVPASQATRNLLMQASAVQQVPAVQPALRAPIQPTYSASATAQMQSARDAAGTIRSSSPLVTPGKISGALAQAIVPDARAFQAVFPAIPQNKGPIAAAAKLAQQRVDEEEKAASLTRKTEDTRARETIALNRRADQDAATVRSAETSRARETLAINRRTDQATAAERAAQTQLGRETIAINRRDSPSFIAASARKQQAEQKPTFGQAFSTGFKSSEDRPFGEMVGQTARVSLFYGVAYRALSLLQQGLQSTITETLAYENALTNLNVVTGRTRDANAGLASALGDIAVGAGFTPSQGVELGSKALGLYGAANAPQSTQERTIGISATVATRMARVAGADPITTQTQLAGALRSLGWGIERLPQLENTISYISAQTGQTPTELLGAVANVSTLGTQSGFSPEQLAALIAQVGTTTGQNPEGTAGQFRQLLSRNATEIAPKASQITGVDLSGKTLAQIFEAVSKMNLTADQLNRFASLFGKGGSQQVATILTQQFGTINTLAGDAKTADGFGQKRFDEVMSSFGNRVKALGSVFMDFGVTLVETGIVDWFAALVLGATELLKAGTSVLDMFNSLPRPLRSVALALGELYAASLVMQRMNVGSLLAGHAAGDVVGGLAGRAAGAVVSGVSVLRTTPATVEGAKQLVSTMGQGLGRLFGTGGPLALRLSAADRAAAGGSLLGRAKGATGLTGLGLGLAGGAAIVVGAGVGSAIETNNRNSDLVANAQTATAGAKTAELMRDAAQQAKNAASEMRGTTLDGLKTGDVMNLLPAIINSLTQGGNIASADKLGMFASKQADAMDAAKAKATSTADQVFAGDFSGTNLDAGLKTLTDRGFTAAQQLDVLNGEFERLIAGSKGAAGAVVADRQVPQLASDIALGAVKSVGQAADYATIQRDAIKAKAHMGQSGIFAQATDLFQGANFEGARKAMTLTPEQQTTLSSSVESAMTNQINSFLTDGVISPYEQSQMVDSVMATVGTSANFTDSNAATQTELRTAIKKSIAKILDVYSPKNIAADPKGYIEAANGVAGKMSDEILAGGGSQYAADRAKLDKLRQNRDLLLSSKKKGDLFGPDDAIALRIADESIRVATAALVQDRLDAAKRLADFQKSGLTNDNILGQIAIDLVPANQASSIAAAQVTRDQNAAASQAMSGGAYVPVDMTASQNAATIQNNLAKQRQAEQVAIAQASATAFVSPGDAIGMAGAQVTGATAALSLLTKDSSAWFAAQGQLTAAQYSYTSAVIQAQNANALSKVDPRNDTGRIAVQIANAKREMSQLPANQQGALRDQINQLNLQMAQAVVGQANAAATAGIAGNRSQMDQSVVSIANAQRDLSSQLSGTQAYYSALGTLREAQAGLASAERDQQNRLRRLGSDLTDPVEQARLDVQAARDQLAADQSSGQGPDVVAQSKIDLKSAQNSQEAAGFSQRISDLQTAEDLGRISHSAYMNYLQSEHDRLTAVASRTRQQQDELDQVDKLMKSAAEQLNGQFNLGSISLPTIYEVRRAIQSGAPSQVADYSNSNNTVNVDGANFDQVVDWLMQFMGGNAQIVRSAPRKV